MEAHCFCSSFATSLKRKKWLFQKQRFKVALPRDCTLPAAVCLPCGARDVKQGGDGSAGGSGSCVAGRKGVMECTRCPAPIHAWEKVVHVQDTHTHTHTLFLPGTMTSQALSKILSIVPRSRRDVGREWRVRRVASQASSSSADDATPDALQMTALRPISFELTRPDWRC